jgi:serine/threonine-protein phosphatase 2B catalytic subunit
MTGEFLGHFGFKEECKMKYGVSVYYKFLLMFQTMPLAAVISTAYGDIFACHGGLSPSFKTLDEISNIDRFIEPESDNSLLDILWSDPIAEENIEDMNDEEYEAFMNIDYRTNPARGCSYAFGYKALREFLDKNNLVCVVRAHEVSS